ncbi:MAG: zinc-dependent peptidase [Pseudomonadota bacterium]|jgi:Mlc titration factor MtfA (ptsG expression regulator)|uniref:zinc-dependent peptidase n=1 Tax=Silanimonas sp. TaxID=1929290 RepID=UPI0022C934AA|nr:zinc-dependent peptidase [Silanimonas sp.]MCZ8114167.1 zinc-dependent peptidase [Silanimonas sp.]
MGRRCTKDDVAGGDHETEPAIDAYTAEAREEFFAISCEFHFTAPAVIRATFPTLAAHLERFRGPTHRV